MSRSVRVAFVALLAPVALSIAACAPATNGTAEAPRDGRTIAAVHVSKCGSCHMPVEPGARSRAELSAALTRHHRRLRLTSSEWSEMLEYLSADANANATTAKATTDNAAR